MVNNRIHYATDKADQTECLRPITARLGGRRVKSVTMGVPLVLLVTDVIPDVDCRACMKEMANV